MKVLQVINSLSAGGAEVFVTQLSIALKQFCDVEVFTFYGVLDEKGKVLRKQLDDNRIKLSIPSFTKKGLKKKLLCPFQIHKKISEYKPDIVHVHLDQCEFYLFQSELFRKNKAKYIRTIHNIKRSERVPKDFWKSIDNFFDFNVHCSSAASEHYKYMGKIDKYKSINNGILIPDTGNYYSIKRELKILENEVVFINIGSFSKRLGSFQKGQDLLIEAIAGLPDLKIKIVFVGDGDERERLESVAREGGFQDKLLFVGKVTDPYKYILSSDIMIMPSRFEGLPISVIEAVCAGLPLVSSDIPSLLEFNLNSTIYFKTESVESLQNAIIEAINNIDRLQVSAKMNSLIYQERFNINKVAKEYFDLFSSIMHGTL